MRLHWHRLVRRFGATPRVRFARLRALAWAVVGIVSFPLGWAESVVLVWIASVYANVASEMATGEAADDRAVVERLDRIERAVGRHRPPRRYASRGPALRRSRLTRPTWPARGYPGRAGPARDAHRHDAVMAYTGGERGRSAGGSAGPA